MNHEQQVNAMAMAINDVLGSDESNDYLCSAYEKITGRTFPTDEEGDIPQEAWTTAMDELLNDAIIQIGESIKKSRIGSLPVSQ